MRKKAAALILAVLGLIQTGGAEPPGAGEEVKIFATLEEASAGLNRPLLLVFFSLDCHVCWEDLFEMKYFIEKYGIPIELIGISSGRPEELRAFLSKYSFPYPVVCDRRKELFRAFKVKLEPFKVILENGRLLYEDDLGEDFFARRERIERWLLEIASR